MPRKEDLHPLLQKAIALWPVITGLFVALTVGGSTALGKVTQWDKTAASEVQVEARVSKLEAERTEIRESLATIKQQGSDNGVHLQNIESRLDARDDRQRR